MSWVLRPAGAVQPRKVRIWMNSFVPSALPSKVLRLLTKGRYSGRTAVTGFSGTPELLYLTDSRTFSVSSSRSEPARLRVVFTVDLRTEEISSKSEFGGNVVHVRDNGKVVCGPTAFELDDVAVGPLPPPTGPADDRQLRVPIKCVVKNPCAPVAWRISFNGEVVIRHQPQSRQVTVEAFMQINAFPAFEIYGQLDDGPPIPIGAHSPDESVAPEDETMIPFKRSVRLDVAGPLAGPL